MPSGQAVPDRPTEPSLSEALSAVVRALATLVGVLTILVGLWLSTQVFAAVSDGVRRPETIQPALDRWAVQVGGEKLTLVLPAQSLPLAPLAAIGVMAFGAAMLVWIVFGMMLTGAKVVLWTAGDPESMRKARQETQP